MLMMIWYKYLALVKLSHSKLVEGSSDAPNFL